MAEKALVVQSPKEVQQERFALLVVFGDGDDGGLSISDASRRVGITPSTGAAWWRSEYVQGLVRDYLSVVRKEVQLKALKLHDKALKTLERAMDSPAYTPTQRAAANDILRYAVGTETSGDTNVGIVVNVATGLPATAMFQQQKRHSKHEDVVEGEATLVE